MTPETAALRRFHTVLLGGGPVGDFGRPMDALPLFIYVNARQPVDALNQQAWGAAFLLLLIVLVINVAVRARSWGRRIG